MKLQEDINRISAWAMLNKLILSAKKTKAIMIKSSSLLKFISGPPDHILNNNLTSFLYSNKNLGIMFDQILSWEPHILQIFQRTITTLKQFNGIHVSFCLKPINSHFPPFYSSISLVFQSFSTRSCPSEFYPPPNRTSVFDKSFLC